MSATTTPSLEVCEDCRISEPSTLVRDQKIRSRVEHLARLLALYYGVAEHPNEDVIQLLDRSVDAACLFRATHS